MEIDMLESCADEVQAAVSKQNAACKRLKKDLARLQKDESSISADVEELTQALHDDVRNACFYSWSIYVILVYILVVFLNFIDYESTDIILGFLFRLLASILAEKLNTGVSTYFCTCLIFVSSSKVMNLLVHWIW